MSDVISDLGALLHERRGWKAAGRAVVFTNGCFDLLHPGHVALLEKARARGRRPRGRPQLRRVGGALKGAGRPIVPAAERAEVLCALEAVTRVVVYDEDTPRASSPRCCPTCW